MRKLESIYYDIEQEKWCMRQGVRSYGLHCGECFDLYIGKTAYPCRLELDTDWYVILPETKFTLHLRTVYQVRM
ncbi:DUF5348 domain-containing protein [Paenibacillus sp. GP183]|uniref:DUF5348 domain-containing protein n=1 Tax=Paenibacillus sp. GP183 TaxID=1882751 RepID=UPI000895AA8C|nr:DUF5348 domain-containing protein [Paenibacillus sp. GP183]SED10857.1 hypothetical protein SAMN05443246_5743 [Paenibacillus sp. GP183]